MLRFARMPNMFSLHQCIRSLWLQLRHLFSENVGEICFRRCPLQTCSATEPLLRFTSSDYIWGKRIDYEVMHRTCTRPGWTFDVVAWSWLRPDAIYVHRMCCLSALISWFCLQSAKRWKQSPDCLVSNLVILLLIWISGILCNALLEGSQSLEQRLGKNCWKTWLDIASDNWRSWRSFKFASWTLSRLPGSEQTGRREIK